MDAVKLLFSDGVLCDYGIILPEQLCAFPHGAGRYLWVREDWAAVNLCASRPEARTKQELETSALFHLYTGMLRVLRGEEAAAFEEIQGQAARDVMQLLQREQADDFSPFRRAEQQLDRSCIASILPGYGKSRQAARAILSLLGESRSNPLYRAVESLLE